MTTIRTAALLSMGQRYTAFLIGLVYAVVMARLMTPYETGIFSLAAGVIGIAHMLRDFSVGDYIVQEKALTRERLRSALALSLIMAWTLAATLYMIADPIAGYYGEPGIAKVLDLLVVSFLLLPFGSITFAVLTKELAFRAIFWVQTLSGLVGAGLGIALAYNGFSYMSMAWATVSSVATTVAILAWIRPRETFLLPRLSGLSHVGRVGGILTAGGLMEQICRRAPDFFVAKTLGFNAVGIFSKAGSMVDAFQDFFSGAIVRVALPAFAKRLKEGADARDDYLNSLRLLAILPLGFFCFLALFAAPLVWVTFGPAWMDAVPLVRIISVAGLLSAPYLFASAALTAKGQVRDVLWAQVLSGVVYVPLLWFASHFELSAVAAAAVIQVLAKTAILQRGMRLGFDLRVPEILCSAAPSAAVVALAAIASAPALLIDDRTTVGALLALMLGAVIAVLTGLACLFAFAHPLAGELRGLGRHLVLHRKRQDH